MIINKLKPNWNVITTREKNYYDQLKNVNFGNKPCPNLQLIIKIYYIGEIII